MCCISDSDWRQRDEVEHTLLLYTLDLAQDVEGNVNYDVEEIVAIDIPTSGPHFDYSGFKNVTALVGNTAYLNCLVKNIGNKTVSWVRHRDIHLLTVGE